MQGLYHNLYLNKKTKIKQGSEYDSFGVQLGFCEIAISSQYTTWGRKQTKKLLDMGNSHWKVKLTTDLKNIVYDWFRQS